MQGDLPGKSSIFNAWNLEDDNFEIPSKTPLQTGSDNADEIK